MMTTVNIGLSDTPPKHVPYNSGSQHPCKTANVHAQQSPDYISTIDEEFNLAIDALACPVCSKVLNHPITLSCGFTVCIACMPQFDPATVENFDCPVPECSEKSHLFGELKVDVTIHKLTQLVAPDKASNSNSMSIFNPVVNHPKAFQNPSSSHLHLTKSSPGSSPHSLEPSRESDCSPLDGASDNEDQTAWKENMLNELECQVCYCLLNEPLTIPCGHTFCKSCLLRFADHSYTCAICRRPLPIARVLQMHPPNSILSYLISTIFPYEQMERQETLKKEEEQASSYTPIFIRSIGYPTIPCYLHVFEPRYRLMIRRCTARGASRRFGMCMGLPGKTFSDIGIMMQIEGAEPLNDGRYLAKAVGLYRFRIKKQSMRDGYNTAQVERFDDDDDAWKDEHNMDSRNDEQTQVECTTESMVREASQFGKLLQHSNVPWILQRIACTNCKMPVDPSSLSWWMAATIPIDDQEKLQILQLTSAHARLSLICEWIKQVQQQWWFQKLIRGSPAPQYTN